MNTKTLTVFALILVLLVLVAQPAIAGLPRWVVRAGQTVIGGAGAYLGTVFSLEKTVNLIEVDLAKDVKETTWSVNQRFVLDPDEAPDDPQRNIFIHSSKPLKSLGGDTLLFKIRADEADQLFPDLTRFTVEGPLISKILEPPKSLQIAYGENGTFRFPGLMTVIINKPDWELSAVGIEGFTVTFEKDALAALVQGLESPEKKAKEVAKTLGTNKGTKTPPKPPDGSSTPPGDDSPDTEPPDTGEKPAEQKPTSDEWYIIG